MRRLFLIFGFFVLVPATGNTETARLDIRGVGEELQDILETALVLPAGAGNGDSINRRWLKRYQRQLPDLVRSALEPYGYFHSEADSEIVREADGDYRLQVDVTAGEPLRVTSLDLELTGPGSDLPELQQKLEDFPLQTGDVLRQVLYEQGKAMLQQSAIDLGFLQAAFEQHQIRVHRGDRRVDILLHLASGPRFRFGETRFEGRGNYPERYLRRYLAYRPGAWFSYDQLGQTQVNLFDADLFRSIHVNALTDETENEQVPVRIELQPAPRHQLRPGIGYGTDTGARVSLRYRNLNLLHRGQELQGDLVLAERYQSLLSTYIIPDIDRLDSHTLLRIGLDREKTDTYLSRKLFSEAEYRRSFGQRLTGSLFLRLSREDFEIGEEDSRSQMLMPGLRLGWKQVDDPLTPNRGLQASLELLGAEQTFFSDTSLLQLSGQATFLQPLPQRFFLLLRLQGGTTWHNDPMQKVPVSLRFFAGGNRSVRGYRYQSLGPKDDLGQVVGGKHLLVANLELEHRFTPKWGVAAFYDIGNAFDDLAEYELEQGVGVGLRRYTRIGSLRLDLARQLGNAENSYRLHFSIGYGW